jgi:hypothetical protein
VPSKVLHEVLPQIYFFEERGGCLTFPGFLSEVLPLVRLFPVEGLCSEKVKKKTQQFSHKAITFIAFSTYNTTKGCRKVPPKVLHEVVSQIYFLKRGQVPDFSRISLKRPHELIIIV